MGSITVKEIDGAVTKARKAGKDVWVINPEQRRGVGRLELRARPSGECIAYFRYADSNGKRDRYRFGYDPTGKSGLPLKDIYIRASQLSLLYQNGTRDVRAHLEHGVAEERARIDTAARERAEQERLAKSGTVRALFDAYIAHLEHQGKTSAGNVRSLVTNHVYAAFPRMADAPAHELTRENASAILSKLIGRGHGRTAAKLRSYGRSGWSCAIEAAGDPTMHPDLYGFSLRTNPWAMIPGKSLAQFNRALDRTLSESELREFLKALDASPDSAARDAIWLALLLGGQRMSQLVRATSHDVDEDARTITLYDGKGARKQPRRHCLPLTDRAYAIVARRLDVAGSSGDGAPHLLTTYGRVAVRMETASNAVTEIARALLKAKIIKQSFTLRDLRRTCETMLARMGISKDLRAQILSHGIGGVQDRHYDRYDYMGEKQRALEAWDARLGEIESGTLRPGVVRLRA